MALDTTISIATSVEARKGVYCFLLGSGVSRDSGIPTAWGIVEDLICRIAAARQEERPEDPIAWWESRFNAPASYSGLLAELGITAPDRSSLLRAYFEPTADDRDQGLKVPTRAHRAIAQLVVNGYVKVILTTNLDRLMEQALTDRGLVPNIIWSKESLDGMMPLQHSDCTVVKLHGDYGELASLNTLEELAEYPPAMNALLDRILTEYGLLVCGWSAEWDKALCNAIMRSTRHRFATFWCAVGAPTGAAQQLIDIRRAQTVNIESADEFFEDLLGKVQSISEYRSADPMSQVVAAATAKRLVAEPRHRIRLEDLVQREVARVVACLDGGDFAVDSPQVDERAVVTRAERADALTSVLGAILAVGCFWGDASHRPIWNRALERLASSGRRGAFAFDVWSDMRNLPAAFVLYSAGVGALAADQYETLKLLLCGCRRWNGQKHTPLVDGLSGEEVVHHGTGNWLFPESTGRPYTPGSDWLYSRLLPRLSDLVGGDRRFAELFDRFEALFSMAYYELCIEGRLSRPTHWIPIGRYRWHQSTDQPVLQTFRSEIKEQGVLWPPLAAGMFGGDATIAAQAIDAIQRRMDGLPL